MVYKELRIPVSIPWSELIKKLSADEIKTKAVELGLHCYLSVSEKGFLGHELYIEGEEERIREFISWFEEKEVPANTIAYLHKKIENIPPNQFDTSFTRSPLIVTTMESVPGRDIEKVMGVVMGTSPSPTWKKDFHRMVNYSPIELSLGRMMDRAKDMGADAIVGVKFNSSDYYSFLAYGTAVTLKDTKEQR